MDKKNIYGIEIAQISMKNLIKDLTIKSKEKNFKGYITAAGVHGLIESHNNENIYLAYKNAYLNIPDGVPLVWYSKIKGSKNIERCFGPEVMDLFLCKTKNENLTHYFYGSTNDVLKKLKDNFEKKYKSNIVGMHSPPFRERKPDELRQIINKINLLNPDIIWVGLGCPKQELFMFKNYNSFNSKIMIGVGAAFDYHSGSIKYAPKIIQKMGLEWLYRLIQEPRRLFGRYFVIIPKFLYLVIKEFFQSIFIRNDHKSQI